MIKQILIAAAAAVLIFKSGIFVFATPVPFVYLFAVHGRREGWLTVLLSLVIVTALLVFKVSDLPDALYFGYFLLMGVILGEGAVRRASLFKMAGLAVVIPWLAIMASFAFLQFGLGVQLFSEMGAYLTSGFEQAIAMQQGGSSAIPAPQLAYIRENAPAIINFMLRTMPSLLFLFSALVVSVTLLLARAITKKTAVLEYLGDISLIKFPFWPVWLTIACWMMFFADVYYVKNVHLKFAAINGLILCAGIYFLQGCLVISFWLKKGRSVFFRLAVYGLIIFFLQVMGIVIIALGLSDQWLNLRKWPRLPAVHKNA